MGTALMAAQITSASASGKRRRERFPLFPIMP
jgi:hypothetical protein